MLLKNLDDICSLSFGMDIIIISVTSPYEELFWTQRLDEMKGQVIKPSTIVLTVYEDWSSGAGNALGTLYAFSKANEKMKKLYHKDLFSELDQQKSVALYHTAGKGTRLAPLTGSEYNSKSKIKLAGMLKSKKGDQPITLLEAIIKQTAVFAPKRKGRLSVFWGDQLFIPSEEIKETQADVDLLIKKLAHMPSEQDWMEQEYYKYGLVLIDNNHHFKQLEKLSFTQFQNLNLKSNQSVGLSLGSFSLSHLFLKNLIQEFSSELLDKKEKLDTDPHLWMPLTWDLSTYKNLMLKQNNSENWSETHYLRMQKLKEHLSKEPSLCTSDLGENTYWWDFGNHAAYLKNHLKLIEPTQEANALKKFLDIQTPIENFSNDSSLKVENSILIHCRIDKGEIKNSVCIDSLAHESYIDHYVSIHVSAQNIDTNESILYNVAEKKDLNLKKQIRADRFCKTHGHLKLYNFLNSPVAWDEKAKENSLSFASLHQLNQRFHPSEGQQAAHAAHHQVKEAVFQIKNQP